MIPVVLLQLALWTACATAFTIYNPEWRIELNSDVKRNAATDAVNDGLTLAIEQKVPQNNDSPALRAAKQAAWLKEKYSRQNSAAFADIGVERRSGNSYKIMNANKPSQTMAAGIDQDGTDYSYFVKAQLGSKSKQVYLLLDTGAGSSWIMGSACTDKPCTTHNTFGPSDSDTFVDNQKSFSISYGTGTVEGNLVSDTISLAGISMKYSFGLASKASDDFTQFAFDGILGMSMNQATSDNFLNSLADGKKIDKNIFGIALNRASDGSNNGEIKFGAVNSDKYTGDISYTSVASKVGDWSIQIDDMAYDRKKAGTGGVLAYVDTGTSFVFGPADLVKKLHAIIPGSASNDGLAFNVPCDSNKALTFTFSGVDYKLSAKDWISPKDSSGKCTSNIYGHEVVQGAWLLGDTFLKNVYTVFDKDEKRIGFAAAAAGPKSGATSVSSPSSDNSTPTKTTLSPTTGAATTLTTGVTSQSDSPSRSKLPPLGLGGHETDATGSVNAAAKPTESTKSAAAAADVRPRQYAKLAAVIFSGAIITVLA
ncbi:hypothetical protein QQS21_011309 [Conoideocrella luteorostrata]|uniref:Peptidase A1 domain-containing protein n=1 Tax=Conoideocrella luteorostrata TaxID=1105319 RepID=A0AAJ0FNH8_9HYPO|nr:hypothetical protein QQS21_011309 [Conoideocrella luteorostrata]